ncbi:MAG: pilus assembly protein TadG-related protein [Actinomycetota bacterium]
MTAGPRERWYGDTGSVTVFAVVAVAGLMVLAGLVVDGGAKVRALQRADRLAAEAGRAGGQAIDVPAAITGDAPTIDTRAAVQAAQLYLRANGVTGEVSVADAGDSLTVNVTTSADTVFLGMVGVHTMTVRGTATVSLVRGVTGAVP